MARSLILLRHGKSDWDTDDDDFDRPLKKRGRKAAAAAGQWLRGHKLSPDYIISSPAKRAVQTAEIACKAMGIKKKSIYRQRHIYLATAEELLHVLADCPQQAQRVLLVGHNPGMEELLFFLVNGNLAIPDDGKIMPTATLAVLAMPDDWAQLDTGAAKVEFIIRPRDIA